MSETKPTIFIEVEAAGRRPFKYRGIGEYSRCVDAEGNIDLGKCDSGLEGIYLEFHLEPGVVDFDGVSHSLEFTGEKSISFAGPEARDHDLGADSPFSRVRDVADHTHHLRIFNKNHEKKEYKYTLRVAARARDTGEEKEWVHDPLIQNTGGGRLN